MILLASVQTAADTAPLTFGQVLIGVTALVLLAAIFAGQALHDACRKVRAASDPTVPRQLTDRNSPLPKEHVQ